MTSFRCVALCGVVIIYVLTASTRAEPPAGNGNDKRGSDRGYICAGPKEEVRVLSFKDGQTLA